MFKLLHPTDYEIGGDPVTVWTKSVMASDFDDSIGVTMHLFQRKVEKNADWRITVMGEQIFCVRIDAPDGLLDWRADYDALTYSVVEPSAELTKQLHAYLERFGLVFGCFDFGITADGEPVFFECNPNGQWAWMEPPTGLPMTVALADLLSKGAT